MDPTRKFTCNICPSGAKNFNNSADALIQHIVHAHLSATNFTTDSSSATYSKCKCFTCALCDFQTSNENIFRRHAEIKHGNVASATGGAKTLNPTDIAAYKIALATLLAEYTMQANLSKTGVTVMTASSRPSISPPVTAPPQRISIVRSRGRGPRTSAPAEATEPLSANGRILELCKEARRNLLPPGGNYAPHSVWCYNCNEPKNGKYPRTIRSHAECHCPINLYKCVPCGYESYSRFSLYNHQATAGCTIKTAAFKKLRGENEPSIVDSVEENVEVLLQVIRECFFPPDRQQCGQDAQNGISEGPSTSTTGSNNHFSVSVKTDSRMIEEPDESDEEDEEELENSDQRNQEKYCFYMDEPVVKKEKK